MEPNDEKSLKSLFVNRHIGQILLGELPPGTRLPSERQISEQMQISRNVVREGLSELATLGFLSIEARKGAYINDYMRDGNMLMLDAICKAGLPLPKDLLKGLWSLRIDIICDSAEKGAILRTLDNLEAMAKILDEQSKLDDCEFERFSMLDFLYQREIYISSGNAFYPLLFNSAKILHQTLSHQFYKNLPDKSTIRELHLKIYNSIKEKKPDVASSYCRKLVEMSFHRLNPGSTLY
jgi:GntR family transcriptional repressor for pyruvate dehydrogenase complex